MPYHLDIDIKRTVPFSSRAFTRNSFGDTPLPCNRCLKELYIHCNIKISGFHFLSFMGVFFFLHLFSEFVSFTTISSVLEEEGGGKKEVVCFFSWLLLLFADFCDKKCNSWECL